jgi:hypothetical protein
MESQAYLGQMAWVLLEPARRNVTELSLYITSPYNHFRAPEI